MFDRHIVGPVQSCPMIWNNMGTHEGARLCIFLSANPLFAHVHEHSIHFQIRFTLPGGDILLDVHVELR